MLLDVEVSRVEEGPKASSLGLGEDEVPRFPEAVADNVEKELRDEDGLRPKVEDLSENGGAGGEGGRWEESGDVSFLLELQRFEERTSRSNQVPEPTCEE